jgi:hypothetical protein
LARRLDPGEVLGSSTVKDLVTGSGIEVEDRDEHALKGVPGSWKLAKRPYDLRHAALSTWLIIGVAAPK